MILHKTCINRTLHILQAITPGNQGLFRRVILQSGSPTVLAPGRAPLETSFSFNNLARSMSCEGNTSAILECLREKPVDNIANVPELTAAGIAAVSSLYNIVYAPRIDGKH